MLFVLLCAAMATAPLTDKPETVRIATFNIWELSAEKLNQESQSGIGSNQQLRNAAEIIQRVRPDILLVNEIDFDQEKRQNAIFFRNCYLNISQNKQKPIDYPYIYFGPVNTGLPTGKDLNNDGKNSGPDDAYGYGKYPGQYGMALFSKFKIDDKNVRTFQKLLWKDMPNNLMPEGSNGKPDWYSAEEAGLMRLSSKSHWDIPVQVGSTTIHLLCSHPTPPVFDGDEDRNGRRNFDEIRFWADYLGGGEKPSYIADDNGVKGPLAAKAPAVILGDLNADPRKNEILYGKHAIDQLLKHPRLQDPKPESKGAAGKNRTGSPEYREQYTCHFGRIDYVLPTKNLKVVASGVFWPELENPLSRLVRDRTDSSDHRMVWIDIIPPTK